MAMVKDEPVALVLDPALIADNDVEDLLGRIRRDRLPTTLYVPMTGASVTRGFALYQAASMEIVFENPDRSVGQLAATALASNHCSYATMLLEALQPALAQLPAALSRAIAQLFSEPATGSLEALARRAALSRRSLDRWLDRAGIESPRLLLAAPRFIRALTLARETELSTRRIAYLCGYSSARRLRTHTRDLTGMTWAELEGSPEPQLIISAIVTRLLPSLGVTSRQQPSLDTPRPIPYTHAGDRRTVDRQETENGTRERRRADSRT